MKSFFIALLSSVSIFAVGQPLTIDDIPLSWADFQVRTLAESQPYTAYIRTSIAYKFVSKIKDGKAYYSAQTQCYIDRSNSFVDATFFEKAYPPQRQAVLNHEKIHLAICFIQHRRLVEMMTSHQFGSSAKIELDSLLALTLENLRKQNMAYDIETNHGLGPAQGKWEKQILKELNERSPSTANLFAMTETPLNYTVSYSKIKDPINFDYRNSATAFEYYFESNRVRTEALKSEFPISMEAPLYKTTDSNVCITEIDFSKDFELNLAFSLDSSVHKTDPVVALSWGITDSFSSAASVAPTEVRFIYFDDKQSRNDEVKSFRLSDRLSNGLNLLSIRKIGEQYQIFLNGKFEKKYSSKPIPRSGSKLAVTAVKGLASLFSLTLVYLHATK